MLYIYMHFIKTAIVTGGSSGIGKSICFELVKNGYEVINGKWSDLKTQNYGIKMANGSSKESQQ